MNRIYNVVQVKRNIVECVQLDMFVSPPVFANNNMSLNTNAGAFIQRTSVQILCIFIA